MEDPNELPTNISDDATDEPIRITSCKRPVPPRRHNVNAVFRGLMFALAISSPVWVVLIIWLINR